MKKGKFFVYTLHNACFFPVIWKRKERTERRIEFSWDCYQFVYNIIQMHLFYSYMYLKRMCWAEVSMPVQNCMQFKKGRIYLPHRFRSFSPYHEKGVARQLSLGQRNMEMWKRQKSREKWIRKREGTGSKEERRGSREVRGREGEACVPCGYFSFPPYYFICTCNWLTVVNCVYAGLQALYLIPYGFIFTNIAGECLTSILAISQGITDD